MYNSRDFVLGSQFLREQPEIHPNLFSLYDILMSEVICRDCGVNLDDTSFKLFCGVIPSLIMCG